jgi:ABC-type glycerol-3-phosphate transport system permease component
MGLNKYDRLKTGLMISFFVFIAILFLMPILWMFISSFKTSGALFTTGFGIALKDFTLKNYLDLNSVPFGRWYLNSLIFAGGYIFLGVFICSLAGFAFAKYSFRCKNIIFLAISKPVLAALAILFSLFAWNELIWPLIVMRTEEMFTLSVGLSSLVGGYEPRYGMLMAGSVLVILPIVALFLKMQEHFISGLTAGGIKG